MDIEFKFTQGDKELFVLEDGTQVTPEQHNRRERSEYVFHRNGERWIHLADGREMRDI